MTISVNRSIQERDIPNAVIFSVDVYHTLLRTCTGIELKTLIVEDVHFIALILERIIVPFCPVDFASNRRITIDLYSKAFIKNDPYDLICLDLLLPEVDGFEVLYHIRHFEDSFNLPEEGSTKIIVVSAFNDSKTVTRARKAGCDGYIAKPFLKDKIIEELKAHGLISSAEDDL